MMMSDIVITIRRIVNFALLILAFSVFKQRTGIVIAGIVYYVVTYTIGIVIVIKKIKYPYHKISIE